MTTSIKVTNRLTQLFEKKNKGLLNIYFTAGFPKLDDTLTIIKALEEAGADLIEIGMPYSDPLADGPTIQESNIVALDGGMTLKVLFKQLEELRKLTNIPVLLMGYLNPVMQYGVEAFCKKAAECGVDGIILPDLPLDEYIEKYKELFEQNNLSNVFLVTPHTSESRIRLIDENTQGFIYIVSMDSTTGGNAKEITGAEPYFKRIESYELKSPKMIGFNVKDNASFSFASSYANGAIIGSAFIKAIQNSKDLKTDITKFVKMVKG
ncbi:MAG TPA: tryptophan synthase subunit alpha [Cytophagaceae bacterium]|jgi:tryptophan synthase alpha chain|nr:tryptophan synthase subunit alpha [Cytophagaceae bacterium]